VQFIIGAQFPSPPRYKPLRLRKHEGCTKLVITLVPPVWDITAYTMAADHGVRTTYRPGDPTPQHNTYCTAFQATCPL